MKNLLSILVVLALATTLSFADVKDNSTSPESVKQGTGSFTCRVLTPLKIDSPTQVDLGVFVKAPAAPYTISTGNVVTFTVEGEKGFPYYYKTSASQTPASALVATITGSWDAVGTGSTTKTLDATTGKNTHVYTVSSLTAIESGTATLDLVVDVLYKSF